MRPPIRTLAGTTLLVAALTLSACGGDSSSESTSSAATDGGEATEADARTEATQKPKLEQLGNRENPSRPT